MGIDSDTLRGLVLIALVVTFAGLYYWVWAGRKDRFSDVANAPFADEPDHPLTQAREQARREASSTEVESK